MGAGIAGHLERIAPEENWTRNQRGPTLRRLFGAHLNADIWALYRRLKQVDDGHGWLNFEEYSKIVPLEEFNRLFVWDVFSQQNQLLDSKELLVVSCLFSSARFPEKARFLMTVFDASHSGACSAAEVTQLVTAVFGVLSRCTGVPAKASALTQLLRESLPELVPQLGEVLEKDEMALHSHIIGTMEFEWLLPSLQAVYDTLPIAGNPPPGACAPDWQGSLPLDKVIEKASHAGGSGPAAVRNLAKDLTHLSWVPDDKENVIAITPKEKSGARAWMVIHGADFASMAKDIAGFRRLFIRSVSTALMLPTGCIEVVNVKSGVVVEFLVRAAARGGDSRDAAALLLLLQEQVQVPNSTLRRGPLGRYAESAELLVGEPKRDATLGSRTCDQAVQTEEEAPPRSADTHRDKAKKRLMRVSSSPSLTDLRPRSAGSGSLSRGSEASPCVKRLGRLPSDAGRSDVFADDRIKLLRDELAAERDRSAKAEAARAAAVAANAEKDRLIAELQRAR